MKKLVTFAHTFLLSSLLLAAEPPAPTSEIPDKRDFPLSSKINPCEDFHQYVCSEAEARFKLREDRSHHVFSLATPENAYCK